MKWYFLVHHHRCHPNLHSLRFRLHFLHLPHQHEKQKNLLYWKPHQLLQLHQQKMYHYPLLRLLHRQHPYHYSNYFHSKYRLHNLD